MRSLSGHLNHFVYKGICCLSAIEDMQSNVLGYRKTMMKIKGGKIK